MGEQRVKELLDTSKPGTLRVKTCSHTGVMVLQAKIRLDLADKTLDEADENWLCLHTGSIPVDKAEALVALQLNPELDYEASRT